jgi:hypothetical protein
LVRPLDKRKKRYNVTRITNVRKTAKMTIPHHHPHRTEVTPSILRLSAWERLAGAAVVIAFLWAAIFWAMA